MKKMKKVLSLLAASMLLCSALSMAASAEGPAYEDGAEYIAYANGAPNWTAVYVNDNTDYKAENVAAAQWNANSNNATLPGQENNEGNKYAQLYINAGDPTRFASSGDTMDLGLCFTAPAAGAYRLDVAATANMEGSDGMKLLVFKQDFTKVKEDAVTADAYTLSQTFELAAGEKVYLFFNKNGHTYTDRLTFTALKMTVLAQPISEAVFTPADTTGVPAVKGSIFRQFFNIKAEPNVKGLWKAFYISDQNKPEALVKDATYDMWVFPDELKGAGVNQYSQIWEGLNNAFMPSDVTLIGDYFTAPVDGKVTVYAKLQYPTDPGDNIAAADGVSVTVYKNKISEDAVVLERTAVTYANSGASGLELKAENVDVKAGDMLIFVYECNDTPYNDSTKVLDKYVAYTEAADIDSLFDCDTTKVRFADGKFTALKSLNIEGLLSAVNASTNMAAALDANGEAIPVATLPAEKAAQLQLYTQSGFYIVGTWPVEVVETFEEGGNTPDPKPTPETGVELPLGLLALTAAAAAGVLFTRKKK